MDHFSEKVELQQLFIAVKQKKVKLLKLLLEGGVDVNHKNHQGLTALMISCSSPGTDSEGVFIVKTLLKHGANANIKDRYGRTALVYAFRYNSEFEVIKALLLNGAVLDVVDIFGSHALGLITNRTLLTQTLSFIKDREMLATCVSNVNGQNAKIGCFSKFADQLDNSNRPLNKLASKKVASCTNETNEIPTSKIESICGQDLSRGSKSCQKFKFKQVDRFPRDFDNMCNITPNYNYTRNSRHHELPEIFLVDKSVLKQGIQQFQKLPPINSKQDRNNGQQKVACCTNETNKTPTSKIESICGQDLSRRPTSCRKSKFIQVDRFPRDFDNMCNITPNYNYMQNSRHHELPEISLVDKSVLKQGIKQFKKLPPINSKQDQNNGQQKVDA